MNRRIHAKTVCFFVFIVLVIFSSFVSAQEVKTEDEIIKDEIKAIETEQAQTLEDLKKKEAVIEKAEKEAENVTEEKQAIESAIEIKKEEAKLARKELAVTKKEATTTRDPETIKKAQELSKKVATLESEMKISRDKLKISESKEDLAKKKIESYKQEIENIRGDLTDLRLERSGKRNFLEQIFMSIGIMLLGLVIFLLLKIGVRRVDRALSRQDQLRENAVTLRLKTLTKLVNWLGGITICVVVLYTVLENHGINVAPLLAGAGIVGLAFGFGGQYLIRDLINGLFVLLEDQYRVNDVVKINENGGLVEDINLRITTLRDLAGRVIIIPNGEIKTVINFTKDYSHALLDIGVAYKENVDEVMQVIKDIGKEMRQDKYFGRIIIDDLEMFGVDDFAESQVTIKFRIKTLPIKQWEVMREFRRRLKNKFDELGIEIPFPHRTVYWGTGKENEWVRHFANRISPKKK